MTKELVGHTRCVMDVKWSNKLNNLLSVSIDETLKFWNVETNTQVNSVNLPCVSENLLIIDSKDICIIGLKGGYFIAI